MRKNEKTTCKLREQVIYLALHRQRVRQQQRTAGQPWGQALRAGSFLPLYYVFTYLSTDFVHKCVKWRAGESAAPAPRRARGAHGLSIAEEEGFNWYFFPPEGSFCRRRGRPGGPRRSRTPAARWRRFCATAGQGRHSCAGTATRSWHFGRDTAMKQDKHKDSVHNASAARRQAGKARRGGAR